jgi:hypothetical protein
VPDLRTFAKHMQAAHQELVEIVKSETAVSRPTKKIQKPAPLPKVALSKPAIKKPAKPAPRTKAAAKAKVEVKKSVRTKMKTNKK